MIKDFDTALRDATDTLLALPGVAPVRDHPVLSGMAAMVALAGCRLDLTQAPHSAKPIPATSPDVSHTDAGRTFLAAVERRVHVLFHNDSDGSLRDQLGLGRSAEITAGMMAAGSTGEQAMALFETVGEAIREVESKIDAACRKFVNSILGRDLGLTGQAEVYRVNEVCNWALCHHLDGNEERGQAMERRLQALGAYGAIYSILMDPEITRAIDEGRQLAPMLMAKLGIDRARLAKLNGVVSQESALRSWQDLSRIVTPLVLHDVPAHRWPDELTNKAWDRHDALLEPSFTRDSARRDALNSFSRDILQPIAAARAEALGMNKYVLVRQFITSMRIDAARPMAERIAWIRTAGQALLGGRGAKAYGEAAAKWHRRVASISALRLEHAAPTPGWPALCQPWTSKDGRATITAITTAEGLVHEGNRMSHCVGGYYSECRTGKTHIFSYAVDGEPMATLELIVRIQSDHLSIRQGQFEGLHRARPDDDAFDHVRTMLDQLRSGRHKVDVDKITRYIRERAQEYEYDAGTNLPLDFVRKAWPLYLPLLPRGTPDTFDAWMETSPVVAAIGGEISRLAGVINAKQAA